MHAESSRHPSQIAPTYYGSTSQMVLLPTPDDLPRLLYKYELCGGVCSCVKIMTPTKSSASLSVNDLFQVNGLVAVVTGGGTGMILHSL
jgi:hypothetical protein